MKKRLDTQAISPRKGRPLQVVSQRCSPPIPRTRDKVIAVGNVKGGVGKTTLALNLTIREALRGTDVLLVDGNEQGTARAFTQLRTDMLGTPGYTSVSLRGAEIRTQVRQLRSKYQRVVIDVHGGSWRPAPPDAKAPIGKRTATLENNAGLPQGP